MGFNPWTRIARIGTSRVATIEPLHDRRVPIQPSLRDGIPMGVPKPWVETHGYVHAVAPRRILGRGCPRSHSRNRQNVCVLAPNQAIPAMVGRNRKPARDGGRRKNTCLPRPVRDRITAVATGGGRPCGSRPQPNDADERTDAIERRLRPAVWPVHLSPPIDPKRRPHTERLKASAANDAIVTD